MSNSDGMINCPAAQCDSPEVVAYCQSHGGGEAVIASHSRDSWCTCQCDGVLERAEQRALQAQEDQGQGPLGTVPTAPGAGAGPGPGAGAGGRVIEKGVDPSTIDAGMLPCYAPDCLNDPKMPDYCQGQEPGAHIVQAKRQGGYCYCACWGGETAPYRIETAEGRQERLDKIAVGTMVKACGLDLEWLDVPMNQSLIPIQSYPQRAIEVEVLKGKMIVPPDHIFVTYQRRLMRAKDLNRYILLLGANGRPIAARYRQLEDAHYKFQFMSTVDRTPPDDLKYHLVNSGGIVSGDYALMQAVAKGTLDASYLVYP